MGNPLRGDDGVGWEMAALLDGDPRLTGVDVRWCHQLTPELAEDVSAATLVVVIDGRDDGSPSGEVRVSPVEPAGGPTRGWTYAHSFDTVALATLTAELFGTVPPVVLVTVAVGQTQPGAPLSPSVKLALGPVTDAVVRIVRDEPLRSAGGPMVTSGTNDPLTALNLALSEVIDAIRELKQARWQVARTSELHAVLDGVFDDLVGWEHLLLEQDEALGASPLSYMRSAAERASPAAWAATAGEDEILATVTEHLNRLAEHVAAAQAQQDREVPREALREVEVGLRGRLDTLPSDHHGG